MAVTFIKRSSIPVAQKGRTASNATVTVTASGQLLLNSLASKHFNGSVKFGLELDRETGVISMSPEGCKRMAKVAKDEFYEFHVGKKTKTLFISATGILKSPEGLNGWYDFAKSGNQTFDAVVDEKTQALTVTLPKGSLTPKPVTPRKKKEKVAPGTKAEAGSTVGTPVAEDELVLD